MCLPIVCVVFLTLLHQACTTHRRLAGVGSTPERLRDPRLLLKLACWLWRAIGSQLCAYMRSSSLELPYIRVCRRV